MLARMLSRGGNQFGTKTDSKPSSDCEDDHEEDGKGNVSFVKLLKLFEDQNFASHSSRLQRIMLRHQIKI